MADTNPDARFDGIEADLIEALTQVAKRHRVNQHVVQIQTIAAELAETFDLWELS